MIPMTYLTAGLLGLSIASGAMAAGGGGAGTKSPTCKKGEVRDDKTGKCVEESRAGDNALFLSARDAAYAAEYDRAIRLLSMMTNQDQPHVLNYLGFAHRKTGRTAAAMTFYQRALDLDPDYILARSYMGQGMVADGDMTGARRELSQIRSRGGADTWAYVMLENAISSGVTY